MLSEEFLAKLRAMRNKNDMEFIEKNKLFKRVLEDDEKNNLEISDSFVSCVKHSVMNKCDCPLLEDCGIRFDDMKNSLLNNIDKYNVKNFYVDVNYEEIGKAVKFFNSIYKKVKVVSLDDMDLFQVLKFSKLR